jgi:hypothetical protein
VIEFLVIGKDWERDEMEPVGGGALKQQSLEKGSHWLNKIGIMKIECGRCVEKWRNK